MRFLRRTLIGILILVTGCFLAPGKGLAEEGASSGGGYAASAQLPGVGYTAKIYDATNGLPTSDANWILCSSDGYVWIGGYSGIIRYDGSAFERMDATGGLTSGRVMMEDHLGRIWVGTNDNGVVVMDGADSIHYTYHDGLTSSSIRSFAEDRNGRVYIGSTNGINYVDPDGIVKPFVSKEKIDHEIIGKLVTAADGSVYGSTLDGTIFRIYPFGETESYSEEELGLKQVNTIFPDPKDPDRIYFGTEGSELYYGVFGDKRENLEQIPVDLPDGVEWISEECQRIWVSSEKLLGYLDTDRKFHVLHNLPMDNSIWMITSDYQGNLWMASSRQGVCKVVTNNFLDMTEEAGLPEEVVNTTCLHQDLLYVGTDNGLRILTKDNRSVENELTEYFRDVRIRCIIEDTDKNLWISAFTGGVGLVRVSPDGKIRSFTTADGLPTEEIRCTSLTRDGRILVGTKAGLSIINGDKVVKTVGEGSSMENTVLLTVEEGIDQKIYLGTDGGGIYVVDGDQISHLGRDDGLSSDVILRIKRDEKRGVLWIITSNSIEYLKDGVITLVNSFPYNNNFDLYFDSQDQVWVLSSYGVFVLKAEELLSDQVTDYRLYTIANGMTGAATANSFSALDEEGNLYISCRTGVSHVNIEQYYDVNARIRTTLRYVTMNDAEIRPDAGGVYTIPAGPGRTVIMPSILDYTMTNPLIHVWLEGTEDPGITAEKSNLTALEYTGLGYGNYTLHVEVLDPSTKRVLQDDIYPITKKPQILELPWFRALIAILLACLVALIVWRIMNSTIIRRQYEEIRVAKEEAERANTAKSRFLANMSHEIRTPINTIMGMDEMILREDTEGVPEEYAKAVKRHAKDIRLASESLLGLINDLLDMSKIESGKMHLVEIEYDVADFLRAIITMIRVKSSEKDLTFETKVDPQLPERLYGDAAKIKQVVLNLLTNAVKYTEHGGVTFAVSLLKKEGETAWLQFLVRDTGIGIKPEDMEKLFTAYERLDEEKNTGIQGTGLGLDISKKFSELMGGEIRVESVYGEGSEFYFTLSQKILEEKGIGEFSEKTEHADSLAYVPQFVAPEAKILVVDDNPMNLTVIKGLLKQTKARVTTAGGGEECLKKLREESFHVVLLDHMMPGMDGIETVQEIRKTHPDLPVYALTANSTAGGDAFYQEKGFTGYLAKPVESEVLERSIKEHLPSDLLQDPEMMEPEAPETLPEDLLWLKETEGISVEAGIKNAGGVSSFVNSLKTFFDYIEEDADAIEQAYEKEELRLYTIKVHALKSSARIIGADALSDLARQCEDAGNEGDLDFISVHTEKLLSDYRKYREKLARLEVDPAEEEKEPVDPEELKEAYDALGDVISMMDYDGAEMILSELTAYRLPPEDAEKTGKLTKLLKKLDWEGMEALLKK